MIKKILYSVIILGIIFGIAYWAYLNDKEEEVKDNSLNQFIEGKFKSIEMQFFEQGIEKDKGQQFADEHEDFLSKQPLE